MDLRKKNEIVRWIYQMQKKKNLSLTSTLKSSMHPGTTCPTRFQRSTFKWLRLVEAASSRSSCQLLVTINFFQANWNYLGEELCLWSPETKVGKSYNTANLGIFEPLEVLGCSDGGTHATHACVDMGGDNSIHTSRFPSPTIGSSRASSG